MTTKPPATMKIANAVIPFLLGQVAFLLSIAAIPFGVVMAALVGASCAIRRITRKEQALPPKQKPRMTYLN
jgi:hypothetical protein